MAGQQQPSDLAAHSWRPGTGADPRSYSLAEQEGFVLQARDALEDISLSQGRWVGKFRLP